MNAKNLPLKLILFVLLPIVLSIAVLSQKELKQGIDLRGGHSLVFEIRTDEREVEDLTGRAEQLKKDRQATADPEQQKKLDDEIRRIEESIARLGESRGNAADLPERIIAILKNRIDPHGLLSLEWRPMGRTRIEVRMPAARKDTQGYKYEYNDALTKLEALNIQAGSIRRVLATSGPAQQEQIAALTGDSDQAKQLAELASIRDRMNQLQATAGDLAQQARAPGLAAEKVQQLLNDSKAAQGEFDNLRMQFADKMDVLQQGNISAAQLQSILRLYVSEPEQETLKKDDVQKRRDQYQKGLADIVKKHPARANEIKNVDALYRKWADSRQGLDDPSDLKRLIAKAGVLEFRMAPQVGKEGFDEAAAQKYKRDLQDNGPDAGRRRNDEFLWFPIRGDREGLYSLVVGDWGGKAYILLNNRAPHMLLRGSSETWRLSEAYPGNDNYGRPAVDFRFDERGAKLFYNLTSIHKGQPMAILLDEEVYSAPNIKEAISERGIIEGKFSQEEVNELVRTLEAGSLPARLAVEDTPSGKVAKAVSESTFGPTFGAENLRLALHAGMWGTLAIAVFMFVYYRLGGVIAVFAMLMNLVLVLGAMGMLNAVLTLPGIAGIILSIGMAVDANVLIYERLREEQERGQSIRMALKLAYERAFSAIFDSNITTLLTCLILGWLGSEEIRGFAITLGLGVLFNLFTAVTVTRWIFQLLLERRIVNKPLHLLKIIGVPKIDWMAKRYWFWGFSLATLVLGLVSLVSQLKGGNMWGIEFSSGTQSIVRLHDDAVLTNPANGKPTLANDGVVGALFRNKAGQLGYDKLKDTARVEQVIDPNRQGTFLRENFPEQEFPTVYPDGKFKRIVPDEWKKAKLNEQAFKMLDKNGDGALDAGELGNLPPNAYQIATVESNAQYVSDAARAAFGKEMVTRSRLDYKPFGGGAVPRMGVEIASGGQARITPKMVQSADKEYQGDLMDYEGGVVFVIQDVNPPVAKTELLQRIREVRLQPDFANQLLNQTSVIELNPAAENTATSFAIMVKPGESLGRGESNWSDFADKEGALLTTALLRQEALETSNFDAAIAGETRTAAVFAVVLGWVVIVVYLWVRFGSVKWGAAAVVCLLHDLTIIIGMVAISGWLYKTPVGQLLGVEAFKIDLIMIAAFLTIIGFSVNDTIVVFDRIRENRGKLTTVSPAIINNAINQTLSRTILTGALTWITVFVMYVWGGSGIHSFNYAMLIGILFGTYSSIAVAAPLLLGMKEVVSYRAAAAAVEAAK